MNAASPMCGRGPSWRATPSTVFPTGPEELITPIASRRPFLPEGSPNRLPLTCGKQITRSPVRDRTKELYVELGRYHWRSIGSHYTCALNASGQDVSQS